MPTCGLGPSRAGAWPGLEGVLLRSPGREGALPSSSTGREA